MGYAANMSVQNGLPLPILLLISDQSCMYDQGEYNSQLSSFNNVTVAPGKTLGPIYVQAKSSGSCALEVSSFTLQVADVGAITIEENDYTYTSSTNTNPDAISADINSSGNPAVIQMTVHG